LIDIPEFGAGLLAKGAGHVIGFAIGEVIGGKRQSQRKNSFPGNYTSEEC
jgi:hypothetical protein